MFYFLGQYLHNHVAWGTFFRLVNYISFRAILAMLTAFVLALLVGSRLIGYLFRRNICDVVEDYGIINVNDKRGTPVMGGILIIGSFLISLLLWCNLGSSYVHIILFSTVWFASLGFADDYLKIRSKSSAAGMSQKTKLLAQALFGLIFGILYLSHASPLPEHLVSKLYLPFLKNPVMDLSYLYVPFIIFVVLAISNSVNFADGLDGLAIVPVSLTATVYGVFAYIIGNTIYASYLNFEYIAGSGELTVVCAALIGAGIGFLWFNAYPAEIFMGDVGSLTLGGILATIAILIKQEFLFPVVGGIFVLEGASVLIQEKIGINLLGRRLFFRAPLHHTFQYRGMSETKVVIRFWIISGLLATLALLSIKIR
jgi:phospho-N-acetylmuramoyl-pentapeptide-transferase